MKAKKLLYILGGGGAALLVLIFIVSICCVHWSFNGNQNLDQVHATATEMIGGHEYIIFDVYNDTEIDEIHAVCNNNFYVKLILQEDWINTDPYTFWGNAAACSRAKIIDLNGYTLSAKRFDTNARYLEIWDSSAAQTGRIVCTEVLSLQSNLVECNLRGGTLQAPTINLYGETFNFCGARVECGQVRIEGSAVCQVPPYMVATYDENGRVLTAQSKCAAYAVSTSTLVSGVYNTAYGYKWNITAGTLSNLTLSADQTYYLYGRNTDGWYEPLNLCCSDGKTWQSV